jgi:hypothetical protein
MATGLNAVTEAAKTDQRNGRNLMAIRKVRRTVPRKKNELIALVQV